MEQLGYSISEAVGYANSMVESRLEEYPEERGLLFTAICVVLQENGILKVHAANNEYLDDAICFYDGDNLNKLLNLLPETQIDQFMSAVLMIKSTLGMD
ncbi:hypothetical protein [Luteibacter sp.]|uniref:hypothetical protein n=1 Tax=Luteibacter sp. TaxID=1886636 RepID=UPI0025C0346D|nr:hypothetical protein [Luteibacter sp.]